MAAIMVVMVVMVVMMDPAICATSQVRGHPIRRPTRRKSLDGALDLNTPFHYVANMALIPTFFLDCVSAIGIEVENKKIWTATGFLVGKFYKEESDAKNYFVFLVTNKHVLKDKKSIIVRFNPKSSSESAALDFSISLLDEGNKPKWVGHPNEDIDVAAIAINTKTLRDMDRKYDYFKPEHIINIKDAATEGISEGSFVYALGYPMGIVDPDRQYVISKSGTIARIRDAFEGKRNEFIIDISIFPGNSGGPVVSKPELTGLEGTKAFPKCSLLGMIKGYIPYKDIAISQQTKRPRVIFEENSGLASVITSDFIIETIETCYATKILPTIEKAEPTETPQPTTENS